jgi:predicted acetyltransferase
MFLDDREQLTPWRAATLRVGYGVAESRRRRAYATAAVGLLIKDVAKTKVASRLLAQTAKAKIGSPRVLEGHGFSVVGATEGAEEGALMIWTRDLMP